MERGYLNRYLPLSLSLFCLTPADSPVLVIAKKIIRLSFHQNVPEANLSRRLQLNGFDYRRVVDSGSSDPSVLHCTTLQFTKSIHTHRAKEHDRWAHCPAVFTSIREARSYLQTSLNWVFWTESHQQTRANYLISPWFGSPRVERFPIFPFCHMQARFRMFGCNFLQRGIRMFRSSFRGSSMESPISVHRTYGKPQTLRLQGVKALVSISPFLTALYQEFSTDSL